MLPMALPVSGDGCKVKREKTRKVVTVRMNKMEASVGFST
jgi:hypothetical protein